MREPVYATHFIQNEYFALVKPWSDAMLKPETQNSTLILPSIDNKIGVPFKVLGNIDGKIVLQEISSAEMPRAILSSEYIAELAKTFVKGGRAPNVGPVRFVEPCPNIN